ncbi:hypothetical protein EVAR_53853_1 [Eumeta japonica]|uniref:Uncharacterized protein n=1 Tax=Eumeta variegata TaxID=151549 RepID=A0A4C1XIQ5_EUMVA|nr:hypothetical protein EVAR_53853_1 [Eumeta japonica]
MGSSSSSSSSSLNLQPVAMTERDKSRYTEGSQPTSRTVWTDGQSAWAAAMTPAHAHGVGYASYGRMTILVVHSHCIRYPNPTQEAGNALVIPLRLRETMGGVAHLLSAGSHAHLHL